MREINYNTDGTATLREGDRETTVKARDVEKAAAEFFEPLPVVDDNADTKLEIGPRIDALLASGAIDEVVAKATKALLGI